MYINDRYRHINRSAINGYREVQIESENNVESCLLHAMIYWLSFHVLRNDIIHPTESGSYILFYFLSE